MSSVAPQTICAEIRGVDYLGRKCDGAVAMATVFTGSNLLHGHLIRPDFGFEQPGMTGVTVKPISVHFMRKDHVPDQHVAELDHDPQVHQNLVGAIVIRSGGGGNEALVNRALPVHFVFFVPG